MWSNKIDFCSVTHGYLDLVKTYTVLMVFFIAIVNCHIVMRKCSITLRFCECVSAFPSETLH